MNWLEFISSVTGSLAWPLSIFAIIFLLRDEIKQILLRIKRLKAPWGIEAEMAEVLLNTKQGIAVALVGSAAQEKPAGRRGGAQAGQPFSEITKEYLYATARISPKAAILEAWQLVESEVRAVARRNNINLSDNPSLEDIVKRIEEFDLLTPRPVNTYIKNLRDLRNKAAHTPEPLTEATAIDYIDTAMLLIHYLRQAM